MHPCKLDLLGLLVRLNIVTLIKGNFDQTQIHCRINKLSLLSCNNHSHREFKNFDYLSPYFEELKQNKNIHYETAILSQGLPCIQSRHL